MAVTWIISNDSKVDVKKRITDNGYVELNIRGDTWVLEHRRVWELFYKTKIPKGYIVHHSDGDKQNNYIGNLTIMPRLHHYCLHRYTKSEFINSRT